MRLRVKLRYRLESRQCAGKRYTQNTYMGCMNRFEYVEWSVRSADIVTMIGSGGLVLDLVREDDHV